jgi:hypothetical protein
MDSFTTEIVMMGDRFGSIRVGGLLTFHFDDADPHYVEVAGEVWCGAPLWCPLHYLAAREAFERAMKGRIYV